MWPHQSIKMPGYLPTSFQAKAVEEAFDLYIAEKRKQLLPLMQMQRRERPLAE